MNTRFFLAAVFLLLIIEYDRTAGERGKVRSFLDCVSIEMYH